MSLCIFVTKEREKEFYMEIFISLIFLYVISSVFKLLNKDTTNSNNNNFRQKSYYKKQKVTWEDVRQKVFEKYGHKCVRCGSIEQIEVHHKIPLKDGGTNDIDNLIPICRSCHQNVHNRKFDASYHKISKYYGFKVSKDKKAKIGFIIFDTIKRHKRLKIRYVASEFYKNKEVTIRIIQPLKIGCGLDFDNEYLRKESQNLDLIYVEAFCELRNQIRIFRLDKITILEVLD